MCSRDEPGRPGNVDTPQQGPFQIGPLDFYVYRWAYTPDSDLEELNKILMTCFAESNHTPTELLDDKDSSEAEDSHIVIGVPHGIAVPLSDIHIFAVVTSYDTDVKQDITASWHISRICIPAAKRGKGTLTNFFKFCVQYFSRDRPFDLYSSIQTLNSVNARKRLDIYKRYGFRVENDTYVELESGHWGHLEYDVDGTTIVYDPYATQKRIIKRGNAVQNAITGCRRYEGKTEACLMVATHEDIEKALVKPLSRGGTRRRYQRKKRTHSRRR
jgi:predicted GNAT family N-acyltransferase